MRVWPGARYPLGARYDGNGTNFAVFSGVAKRVELCLFDESGGNEERVRLREVDAFVWHGYLPDVGPGRRYGFRVHGPYEPAQGLRCNPHKLLLDPYAQAIDGDGRPDESLYGYDWGDAGTMSTVDSAHAMPRAVVVDPAFDWGGDTLPRTPYHHTLVYEAHV